MKVIVQRKPAWINNLKGSRQVPWRNDLRNRYIIWWKLRWLRFSLISSTSEIELVSIEFISNSINLVEDSFNNRNLNNSLSFKGDIRVNVVVYVVGPCDDDAVDESEWDEEKEDGGGVMWL